MNYRLKYEGSQRMLAKATAQISEQAAVIAKAVEVLDRGCTCHGYECHCDSSNVTDARSILESGPVPQPAQEKPSPVAKEDSHGS